MSFAELGVLTLFHERDWASSETKIMSNYEILIKVTWKQNIDNKSRSEREMFGASNYFVLHERNLEPFNAFFCFSFNFRGLQQLRAKKALEFSKGAK